MKRLLLLGLAVMFLFTGCNYAFMRVENNTPSKIYSNYKFSTGTDSRTMKVKEDQALLVDYEILVDGGTFFASILDDHDQVLDVLTETSSGTLRYESDKDVKYTIYIETDGAKGSYMFDWYYED